jgi:hypothetical protein
MRRSCILKAREPARILKAIGKKQEDRWHLEYKQRRVDQYNFYLHDSEWGRMFIRVCPYFPFPVRLCLNQHYRLAQQMRRKGIRFRQSTNAFSQCSDPVFEKLYAPLTSGILKPFKHDRHVHDEKTAPLDKLYRRVAHAHTISHGRA